MLILGAILLILGLFGLPTAAAAVYFVWVGAILIIAGLVLNFTSWGGGGTGVRRRYY